MASTVLEKYLRGSNSLGFCASCTGGGQAQVGVDVHLVHAVLDALDDFLDRHGSRSRRRTR